VNRAPEAPPPARSLGASVAVHAVLLSIALLLPVVLHLVGETPPPPMEVEITSPYLGTGPAKLGAPKSFVPGKIAPVNATADKALVPVEPPKTAAKAPESPKEWATPKKPVEPPKPVPAASSSENGTGTQTTPGGDAGGEGTAAKKGGSGEGSDEGVVGGTGDGGTRLHAFPKLLNRDEVLASLRRFYPESERDAGHEADVAVMIHVGVDGLVHSVDVTKSANPAFDAAAQKVGYLMRFSPAIGMNDKPVPVRMPQPIMFRLEN